MKDRGQVSWPNAELGLQAILSVRQVNIFGLTGQFGTLGELWAGFGDDILGLAMFKLAPLG